MEQIQIDFDYLKVGSKITARPDGKLRGGTVQKLKEGGTVVAEFPVAGIYKLEEDEFQLSSRWDNPKERMNL